MKGDEGKRLQIGVGPQLLRRGVVLVVLVAPVAAGHAAAQAVDHHLQMTVDLDVPRERVVAALVLEPAAAALRDAADKGAEPPPAAPDEEEGGVVHDDDLDAAEDHVPNVRIEVPLRDERRSQDLIVAREGILGVGVVLIDRARGERAEHLVGGLGAQVEVVVRVRRVRSQLVFDNRTSRVAARKLAHIVNSPVDNHLAVLLEGEDSQVGGIDSIIIRHPMELLR